MTEPIGLKGAVGYNRAAHRGLPMKRFTGIAALLIVLVVGLWWLLSGSGQRRPGDARAIEALRTLPYATWTEVSEEDRLKNGVVIWDRERASPGINLFTVESAAGALLVDMAGNVVLELRDSRPEPSNWKLIEPSALDTFTALTTDGVIFNLDARSQRNWTREGTFLHHDFHLDPAGNLYALEQVVTRLPEFSRVKKIRDDHLIKMAPDGVRMWDLSSAELVEKEPELFDVMRAQSHSPFDLEIDTFHTNTIWVFPEDVVRNGKRIFYAGDVLVCWRNLDTVAAIDPVAKRVRWHWGAGELDRPHQPTLLDNGNLLIFDNGKERGWCRVVEIDPERGEIVWEYRGDPAESFYSSSRGAAQRLPNGNTLVTDSMTGRALEVTLAGETVWEYFEPRTRKRYMRLERATIYRMTRIPGWPEEAIGGLGDGGTPASPGP